jgi:hypothetical protein
VDAPRQFCERGDHMNLLIIVTSPDPEYQLWELTQASGWQDDDVLAETSVKTFDVGDDKIVILCQASPPLANSKEKSKRKTTGWVTEIAKSPKYGADVKVHIAAHSGYVDVKAVQSEVDNTRLVACASFSHMIKATGIDDVSDALYQLLPQPQRKAFKAALMAVKTQQTLTHAHRLSTLKHRLAHLFLPISVDLQAWSGYGFDDEYMREILSSYGDETERLESARALLYGAGQHGDDESIEKIVEESGLEDSEAWKKVKILLPQREPVSDEEKSAAAAYSHVFQRLDVLGSLKDKTELKRLKDSLRSGQNPFNEWYAELDGALVELRSQMHGAH